MADIHIEDFYHDVARILIHLYNRFPRKGAVFVEDIAGEDTPDEFGLHSTRHMACFGAMLWLCDEGLLRYESVISQDAIDQAVLTGIGFNRLSTMRTDLPVIPEPATSGILAREPAIAINHIRRTMREGTSTELSETVHRLLFERAPST
jgi:hypothetical protein